MEKLVWIPPELAPDIWPKIEPYVKEALAYGGGKYKAFNWLAKILTGVSDLFVTQELDGMMICDLVVFPEKRVYVGVLLGGDGGHNWDAFDNTFMEAAKARGCDYVEMYGRGGWRKIMKELDYELVEHVWRKEI